MNKIINDFGDEWEKFDQRNLNKEQNKLQKKCRFRSKWQTHKSAELSSSLQFRV